MKRLVLPAVLLLTTHCGFERSEKKASETAPERAAEPKGEEGAPAAAPAGPSSTELGATAHERAAQAFTAEFQAKVFDEELKCFDGSDELLQKGQVFKDVRMFITNLRLVDATGGEHRVALETRDGSGNLQFVDAAGRGIALLDFLAPGCASSDATQQIKTSVTGTLPAGSYREIRFELGLPYQARAPELAAMPAALAPSDMGWMWSHFPAHVQIEMGTGRAHGDEKKILNILATQAAGSISLPLTYEHVAGASAVTLNLDFGKLFATTPVAFVTGIERACHNDSKPLTEDSVQCAHAYKALGLSVANPRQPYEQRVFSVVP